MYRGIRLEAYELNARQLAMLEAAEALTSEMPSIIERSIAVDGGLRGVRFETGKTTVDMVCAVAALAEKADDYDAGALILAHIHKASRELYESTQREMGLLPRVDELRAIQEKLVVLARPSGVWEEMAIEEMAFDSEEAP